VARCCRLRPAVGRRDVVRPLARARVVLVGAAAGSVAILATGFPAGTLVRQQEAIAAADRQLATVEVRNTEVRSEIASLKQRSTIEAIAREDYGLVRPGQRSYVILPGGGGRAVGAGTLGVRPIPTVDLVPTAVSTFGSPPTGSGVRQQSLWNRTLGELEFWRWAL